MWNRKMIITFCCIVLLLYFYCIGISHNNSFWRSIRSKS